MTAGSPRGKAIIVAAGRGSRLGPNTDEIPKCMVTVGGRPMLHRQLDALTAAGVDDVVIVRGYRGDRIDPGAHRVRFVENAEWQRNNILASFLMAEAEMTGGFYFSYSDIVYAPAVARALVAAVDGSPGADSFLVVDRAWSLAYEGRTLHPVSEAELAQSETAPPSSRQGPSGERLVQVGKRAVAASAASGEFIGLGYLAAAAADGLRALWHRARAVAGDEAPFGRAPALRVAYLSDGLNALIAEGHTLRPVYIDGGWREIDTGQDLERAEASLPSWT